MEIVSKLKKGKSIEQKVLDKLTQEEMQVYFKTNMQANDGSLNLYSLKSLPDGIKFPERCEYLKLNSLQSLPSDLFKNNPDLKGMGKNNGGSKMNDKFNIEVYAITPNRTGYINLDDEMDLKIMIEKDGKEIVLNYKEFKQLNDKVSNLLKSMRRYK